MKNDINDLHLRFVQLVMEMKKEGHDPLAIAGCMLAGAVQMYQSELGMQTTSDLLDQIANGSDDDYDCLLYTSPSPRDNRVSRMPSSA